MTVPKILYLGCPLCGSTRPLKKTGARATMKGKPLTKGVKGIQHFNRVDVSKQFVVQERGCYGNCKEGPKGFPILDGLLLAQVKTDKRFGWLKDEIIVKCREILGVLEGAR